MFFELSYLSSNKHIDDVFDWFLKELPLIAEGGEKERIKQLEAENAKLLKNLQLIAEGAALKNHPNNLYNPTRFGASD